MRIHLRLKSVLAILLLLNATTFSSCMNDVDIAPTSTQSPTLPLPAGPYKVTGMIYNYNGSITWAGPSAPIPSGYTSTVDLSVYSPKIAGSIAPVTLEIAFADIPLLSGNRAYYVSSNINYSAISFDFPAVMYQQYSNISRYVVSYVPATATQKASFHLMTKYNTLPGGAGNDRIVDEYLVQM